MEYVQILKYCDIVNMEFLKSVHKNINSSCNNGYIYIGCHYAVG